MLPKSILSPLLGLVLTGMALVNLFQDFLQVQQNHWDDSSLLNGSAAVGFVSTATNPTRNNDLLSVVSDRITTTTTTTTTMLSFKDESRLGNGTKMSMYKTNYTFDRQDDAAMHLESTFDGFHDFLVDGPRRRPFSSGLAVTAELLMRQANSGSTSKNYDDGVSFFQSKGAYYAAAWLSTTETFLSNTKLDLQANRKKSERGWNMEAGTWVGIKGRKNHRTNDMLDFFVHHLSRYKGPYSVRGPDQESNWEMYLEGLDAMQYTYEERPFNNPSMDRNGRILVMCPYHGTSDNHSGQDEKRLHLNVTIKALARVFPNIVVTVCDDVNLNYVASESGLNEYLYDVLLVKNLSMAPILKCTHLPFLSNVQVRRLLQKGYYSTDQFDWIYYTESDQPPHLTSLNALLKETLYKNRTVVVPHRSHPIALPRDLNVSMASKQTKRFLEINSAKVLHRVDDLREYSCCFLGKNKTAWEAPDVELFQQYNGHAQVTGECNPFQLTCNICKFRNRTKAGPCRRGPNSIS
ncbi:unnamed protein product [Cylindrotheca closterium]|uniref:Uncharacterized protein n=1 Tax=Cylindrotheca closterium TaxID=2856 RepID=A0AAD2G4L0_9STRA|nr:unnamed protein product [Cylindrotheca closterium]